ncbi:membrane-associated protein in eicosanoid and glutathione metabolism (MAPEG) [Reticulomyxa filosa]|uniref:Microsomal glutathione S-transferase 1 n=1 Tax=Reticulomyxa filosa TaxID=46433 RepID=X6NPE2_RETFI|nr:membrane-associated protein in eicosanoid and glutathione metabolism (MAPEG) [Reticulomyxa filosa]|eukprot:ETO27559.1 membrane-associated protein in eicosanoid and glutathione metabolism (MAPEG) [Reticulomyxa filosa]
MSDLERTRKVVVLCTAGLFCKFLLTSLLQGAKRVRAPEDGFQLLKTKKDDDKSKEKLFDTEKRWQRIILNDLENIPIGLLLLWGGLIIPSSNNNTTRICSIVFLVSRILHSFFYIFQLMPWRFFAWLSGLLSIIAHLLIWFLLFFKLFFLLFIQFKPCK